MRVLMEVAASGCSNWFSQRRYSSRSGSRACTYSSGSVQRAPWDARDDYWGKPIFADGSLGKVSSLIRQTQFALPADLRCLRGRL